MKTLNNIIMNSGLPRETKLVFEQMQIKRVQICQNKRQCTIHIELPEEINEIDKEVFCKIIKERLSGAKEVFLRIDIRSRLVTLENLISEYRDELINLLDRKIQGIKSWLILATWKCHKEHLVIGLPHSINVDICNQKGVTRTLEEIIREKYCINVLVKIEEQEELARQLEHICAEIDKEHLESVSSEQMESSKPSKPSESNQNEIIYGKTIKGDPFSIDKIVEEEKSVIIVGEIIDLETRELRSGRKLIIFDITDYVNSINVKLFLDEKNSNLNNDALKKGCWVKVRGSVQTDRYSQELTLMANDINMASAPERIDDALEKRVELHLHTKMSSMDSVVDIKKIIARAAKWGHKAIAITDHGVVQAFPDAYDAGQQYGIKIIYGVEGYLVDDLDSDLPWNKLKANHVIILVQSQKGLFNFYKLISMSHLDYYHRTPRILKSILSEYREGLIIGSACEAGELYRAILQGINEEKVKNIANYYDYLEIQPLGNNEFLVRKDEVADFQDLININKKIIALGDELNKPVVATGDVHFLNSTDAIYRQILMAGKGFADDSQPPLFFRTTNEMLSEFDYLDQETAYKLVIETPNYIADQIEDILPIPRDLYQPEIEGAEEQVNDMTLGTAKSWYGEELPQVVRERVDKELNSIITHGFSVLYLIAHKLVKNSNDDGYLVGSRGSVGSSFVATMMGITEVNPLPPHYRCSNCKYSKFITDGSVGGGADLPESNCPICNIPLIKDGHDIPFEVFLGFKGDKTPDIDLNFSGDYQPNAMKYVEELFGKNHVFRAGTIATIAERTAYGYVKNFLDEKKIIARDAEIKRLVTGCSGVKRTTGQHPGGLMVVPTHLDIHQFCPIQHPADDIKSDTITTHFDYHSISSRLVKLDILGHDDPTVIKMLEDLTGVDAKTIKLDDADTLSLFSGVEALVVKPEDIRSKMGTYGIPEFGTKFVRQMLEDTKPKSFSELIRISGFSHGTDVWLNNAQDLIRSGTANMSELISTRDDIMVYLIYRGLDPNIAFKIMEDVRKGKGVKPEYIEAMKEKNVPQWYIDSCNKIKYMFPKAHAVAYVMMAFRIAWFKINYPEAFYASFFTVRADEFDADLIVKGVKAISKKIDEIEGKGNDVTQKEKNMITILELALEMYCRGVKILHVNLEHSAATQFMITKEGILPPFASLQGLGETAAQNLVEARLEKSFTSWSDIRARARASKTVIDILATHGCIKHLPETSQMALF